MFDLTSNEGRDYRVFVSAPMGEPPSSGYPVVYVLDANAYFPLAASLNHLRSRAPSTGAIVVGIGYPIDGSFDMQRRTFDLTTKASPEKLPPARGGKGWPESGGADQFLAFIQGELKPMIAEKYAANPADQTIVGHSFGGLFVMHTLFTQPEAFQTYVAISPSGWWSDYALLTEEKAFANRVDSLKSAVRLLIEVGELELAGNQGPAAALAPTSASKAFGTTANFAERLKKLRSKSFEVGYQAFEGEGHGSVVPPAMIEAFKFALPAASRPSPVRTSSGR
ncbi:alpha/beta hydrolase-fold protein [Bremerella sp. JC770]|uniref:alpha/beta hydrolase n=1 Tax=Bremerella sp. JC770 TaxID=3232137 RepID=UPI00345AC451